MNNWTSGRTIPTFIQWIELYSQVSRVLQTSCIGYHIGHTIVFYYFLFFLVSCTSYWGYTTLTRGDFDNCIIASFKYLMQVSLYVSSRYENIFSCLTTPLSSSPIYSKMDLQKTPSCIFLFKLESFWTILSHVRWRWVILPRGLADDAPASYSTTRKIMSSFPWLPLLCCWRPPGSHTFSWICSSAPFPCYLFLPATPAGFLMSHTSMMTASCASYSINLFISSVSLSS
jgi:hypothetical protein